jgi:hypothetical protein
MHKYCCPLWFRTPPSSDIKIARLRFLFILRLRTGIDLRDQADLASARSVTIRSWFSDCIGTSSLARRSQIVRVASHQIEVISTHWKIRNFASIKWYQLFRFIGEFYLVFSPSYSPQKNPTNIYFQVRSFPQQPFGLAHSFNMCLCWICVLTRSIVAGYLCFLSFVPSFLVTLVSSPLLIHPPPRVHIHRAAVSRSPHPCSVVR